MFKRLKLSVPSATSLRAWSVGLAACMVAAGSSAAEARPVAVVGHAKAVVVKRLSFIKTEDLDFGRILPGTSAGTVTIKPDGTRAATGGARFSGGDSHPATFAGYGSPNQIVMIELSRNTVQLRRTGGTETMRLETFVIGSTPQAQLTTSPMAFRIATSTGMFAFPVGATLRVGARQAPGIYSGTFSLVLEYQ